MEHRAKGISILFMLGYLEQLLSRQFGVEFTDETTFEDLARLLWGPPGTFTAAVDFLGHASMLDPNDGEAGASLTDAIDAMFPGHVGKATLFISWTWRYKVRGFLNTLRAYCLDNRVGQDQYIWMCFFCNNQRQWLSGVRNSAAEEFADMVTYIGKVVSVVDNYRAADAQYFQRLWPVYEIFVASQQGITITLALMEEACDELQNERLGQLRNAIDVDVMQASASVQADVVAIRSQIAAGQGGANRVNQVVRDLFVEMLQKLFQQCLRA
mmetsp:Transcript_15180/g.33849  ORF Transcript_15180/g.33849 Transcript_15180/m.33849 type:complete len:269 (-) Transcript_15180:30-836(-)